MGLHFSLWGTDPTITFPRDSMDRLREHRALTAELAELFDVLDDQAEHLPEPLDDHMGWDHRIPLAVHSRASLDEIMAAFGRMTFDRPNRLRQASTSTRRQIAIFFRHPRESRASLLANDDVSGLCDLSGPVPLGVTVNDVARIADRVRRYLNHQTWAPTSSCSFDIARKRPGEHRHTRVWAPRIMSPTKEAVPSRSPGGLRKPMPDDFFREAKVAAG